ncbi:unnamed protein product [Moneuplotes crassus]|uniref:Uncharacterized protein n=1 Tax=Euplotes crassus TaxID=5936 RepID=A0AAD1UCD8_EUPCR|nr:unnamed protein product [Moneuplotes crassus]
MLHKEAARMFPYSSHGEKIAKTDIQDLVNRLDVVKDLTFLKGKNCREVMEKALNEQEKKNITNSIMRKVKFEQKMRMSEFKRQVKIAQKNERIRKGTPKWTRSDTIKQIKQHKKSFIEYIGDICTKKEETVARNTDINVPKQRYFLNKRERDKISQDTKNKVPASKMARSYTQGIKISLAKIGIEEDAPYQESHDILKAKAASRLNSLRRNKQHYPKIDTVKIISGVI